MPEAQGMGSPNQDAGWLHGGVEGYMFVWGQVSSGTAPPLPRTIHWAGPEDAMAEHAAILHEPITQNRLGGYGRWAASLKA